MTETERLLAEALTQLTPPPPRTISGAEVRGLAATRRRRLLPVAPSRRFEVALVAAAMVVVVGSAVALVTWPSHSATTRQISASLNAGCNASAPAPSVTPTGTPPPMLPASVFGPQARRDGTGSGTASYEVYPNQSPTWQVIEAGTAFADEAQARAFAASAVNAWRCKAGTIEVRPASAGTLADTAFFHDAPGGGYADGTWYIITARGTHVLTLSAQAVNDPPAGGPGDEFLVTLAAAAQRAADGLTPNAVTPPRTPGAAPLPPTFLTLTDLGPGWTLGTGLGDSGTVTTTSVPGAACADINLPLRTPGHRVVYRGTQPLGDKEWLLDESVVTLTTAGATQARSALQAAATDCTSMTVLISGTGIAGDYVLALRPQTEPGNANVYILSGATLITLETLPGGAIGGVPLPGGDTWLTTTSKKAVTRAHTH